MGCVCDVLYQIKLCCFVVQTPLSQHVVAGGRRYGRFGVTVFGTRWSLLPTGSHLRVGLSRQC